MHIENPVDFKCADFNWQSANYQITKLPNYQISRIISRSHRRPRAATSDPLQGLPSTAHDSVSRDDDFRVMAAGWREAAAEPGPRRQRRQRVLIGPNPGERERLRVQCQDAQKHRQSDFKGGSRTR
jgi:hypothetical protein